jgi:3-isopropylmalate/(R)-2-methylmalate dehydratase small subunit
VFDFAMVESARHKLLNGLDAIGLTLSFEQQISDYEAHIPAWYA